MAAVIAPHNAPWHRTPPLGGAGDRSSRPALRLVPSGTGSSSARRAPSAPAARPDAVTRPHGRIAVVVAGTLAAVLIALALSGLVNLAGAGAAAHEPAPTAASPLATVPAAAAEVVVREGDTLWSIARSLRPEGDVRAVVDQLAQRSGGPQLQPGQRIDVTGLG